MANRYNGFLPVGSGDDSVVLECAMTSEADITSNSGTLVSGASVSSSGATAGSSGAVDFDLTGLSAAQKAELQYAGSISVDVSYLDVSTPLAEHSTAVDKSNTYYIHCNETQDNTLPYLRLYNQGAADVIIGQVSATADSITNTQAINQVIGEETGYTRLTLSWNGGESKVYANGVLIETNTRAAYTADIFEYIRVGSLLSGASGVEGATFKNLVLSTRPVQFSTHPSLANVVWYGDSFVDQNGTAGFYMSGCLEAFDAYFRRIGFKSSAIEAGVSGATVVDGANDIASQIDGTNSTKPNQGVNDHNPVIVCYRGGTNDALNLSTNVATFTTDLQADMTSILAVADYVIVGTITSLDNDSTYTGDTDYQGNVAALNAVIEALPAWWDTANPSDTGRIKIVDQFTEFGGNTPTSRLYQDDNYHPSGVGSWKMGELYAKKAAELLG